MAEYEETFTSVLMASGLTKMTARVLTCLFTTDAGSLTASQLAQRLQVSPASISKAIAFLESQSLVRRERDERRRDRYVVDDDAWYEATIASARANDQLVATARQGVAILGPHTPPPPAWRTSPASSTSSAKASPAPPNRPAKSSTPNPKQPRTTPPHQVRTTDRQPSRVDNPLERHSHETKSAAFGET